MNAFVKNVNADTDNYIVSRTDTTIKKIQFNGEMLELYVNKSVNVALDVKKPTTMYRIKNGVILSKLGDDYKCMNIKVDGVDRKCSRYKLVSDMIGEKYKTKSTKVTKGVSKVFPKAITPTIEFKPENTKIVDGFIFNEAMNVKFDLMTGGAFKASNGKEMSKKVCFLKYKTANGIVALSLNNLRAITVMYGIDMPKSAHVMLKDKSLGYTKENLNIIPKSEYASINRKQVLARKGQYTVEKPTTLSEIKSNVMYNYITEDFMVFNNDDAALEHQIKVDGAKEVTQLLIDNKCGWALAEQVYLKTMNMDRKDTKYKNFIDVMNNTSGVKTITKEQIEVKIDLVSVCVDVQNAEKAKGIINNINTLVEELKSM